MRLLRFGLVAATCCGALVLSGCPDKPAATPDSDAGVAEAPQVPATPPPTRFSLSYQASPSAPVAAPANGDSGTADDAGTAAEGLAEVALAPDDASIIEPTTVLELRTTLPLKNYRVRLFDEADRAMISDDDAEESEAGLVYRVRLPQPLKSGFKYTLVVDAQTGTAFTDGLGREVDEFRQTLQIAGEKEKPAPAPKPTGKKKRR